MKAKVLISFSGAVTGAVGEIMEITSEVIYKDLLKAGYIEQLEETPAPVETPVEETPSPKKRKKRV